MFKKTLAEGKNCR